MILQGNGSGHDEHKQAWQALIGPFGSSQCLQLSEHKQASETLNWPSIYLKAFLALSLVTWWTQGRTDKHWMGPPIPFSACSWVNASTPHNSSMILQCNGSGHGERKQGWQALTGPFGSSQCLQLGERKHESGYRCESLNHLNTEIST